MTAPGQIVLTEAEVKAAVADCLGWHPDDNGLRQILKRAIAQVNQCRFGDCAGTIRRHKDTGELAERIWWHDILGDTCLAWRTVKDGEKTGVTFDDRMKLDEWPIIHQPGCGWYTLAFEKAAKTESAA